ncbi:MAG: hypothetical protein PHS02_02075 [Candidatus ainarchaeum sp.]|nr:hypothetical protein [Candidatus ainarchaeum sp.]
MVTYSWHSNPNGHNGKWPPILGYRETKVKAPKGNGWDRELFVEHVEHALTTNAGFGDLGVLKRTGDAIKNGMPTTPRDWEDAIKVAAKRGNWEIYKWLVDESKDVRLDVYTLIYAAAGGNVEIVKSVLERLLKDVDPKHADQHGKDREKLERMLLEAGLDPNALNLSGATLVDALVAGKDDAKQILAKREAMQETLTKAHITLGGKASLDASLLDEAKGIMKR